MLRKAIGSVVLLLGVLALLLGLFGYGQASEMAPLAGGSSSDVVTWESHWRAATITYATLGALMAVGGALILQGYIWGTLVAAAAVATGGALPWIATMTNYARFDFESPNAVETILLFGMAVFLGILFMHREKWSGMATADKS